MDEGENGGTADADGERSAYTRRGVCKHALSVAIASTALGAGSGTVTAESATMTNEHLEVAVNDDGTFELRTADGGQLTYPSAGTSGLTVQVDGTDYVIGTPPGESMGQYRTRGTQFTEDETVATTEWDLPGGLAVTQEIRLAGESTRFRLQLRNAGSETRRVRVRYLHDYQVGPQDGAPVFVNGSVLTSETRFESPSFDTWQTYDQLPDPTLTGRGTLGDTPTKIEFVAWPDAQTSGYEYEAFDPSREFYTPGSTTSPESDSAGLLYYDLGSLEPGAEESIVTFYGVDEPDRSEIDTLERSLEQFEKAVTSLLSTTVRSRAGAHAQLYAELGDEYAEDFVNYFGYQAGIDGIEPDDVTSEFRDQMDSLTDGIEQPNAETLYEFFDELFNAASPDDSVEELREAFAAYFRGTADGQDAVLRLNGSTIDELESAFQEDFENRRTEAIEALREEPPSRDVISDLIEFVTEKEQRVRTRETELERSLSDAVDAIRNGEETRAIGGKIETAGYGVLAVGLIAAPATGGSSKLVSLPVGGTLALVGKGVTAVGAVAGISALYSGSASTASLGWMQYSSAYWTMLTTWANSGPSARGVVETMIADEALEQIGLSPEAILQDYTGIEIDLVTGLDDIAATQVEYMLDGAVEFVDAIGREIVVSDVTAPGISEGDIEDGVASETATVTIENRSEDAVTPSLNHDQTEIRSVGIGSVRPFPDVGSYVYQTDSMPTIPPGESATIELEYGLPTEGGTPRWPFGRYELEVSVSASPARMADGSAVDTFTFVDLPDLPEIDTRELLDGRLDSRESEMEVTSTPPDVDRISVDMSYGGSDFDLHLFGDGGGHVGRNYDTGEFEEGISDALASGPDGVGESYERIVVDDPAGDYEVEVLALEANDTDYSTYLTEIPDLDPFLAATPGAIEIRADAGEVERLLALEEVTRTGPVTGVTLAATELTTEADDRIPAENVDVDRNELDVDAGGTETVTVAVDIPEAAGTGTYTGQIEVSGNGGTRNVPVEVVTGDPDGSGDESFLFGLSRNEVAAAGAVSVGMLYLAARMLSSDGSS